eukprot:229775-Amphidinium_carterae.1
MSLAAAWELAFSESQQCIADAVTLLCSPWLISLPLSAAASEEIVIVALYYTGEPGSQATSAVICTPTPVGAEVTDGLQTSVMAYAADGSEQGSVDVTIALIEPAFLCGKITESCPAECGVLAFSPDEPGSLPRGGNVFALLDMPNIFTSGVLLYLDVGDSCLRFSAEGEHNEVVCWRGGYCIRGARCKHLWHWWRHTQGAKAPSLIGFRAPTAKLLDVLSTGDAPAKAKARRPSTVSGGAAAAAASMGATPKVSSSMNSEVLAAIAAIGDRLTKLEHQQQTSPPQATLPPASVKASISRSPAAMSMASSLQSEQERQPMLRASSVVPPVTGSVPCPYEAERRIARDGGARILDPPTVELAIQLAMLEALERIDKKEKSTEESDVGDDILAAMSGEGDLDFGAASGAEGAAALTKLIDSIERFPDKWSNQFDRACATACGAYKTGLPWSVSLYADRCVRFKGLETHERAFATLGHLHMLSRIGQYALLGARLGQFLKIIESSIAIGGNWLLTGLPVKIIESSIAIGGNWLLTGLPEIRSASNTRFGRRLGHPAEYAASIGYLKQQTARHPSQTLEEADKSQERRTRVARAYMCSEGAGLSRCLSKLISGEDGFGYQAAFKHDHLQVLRRKRSRLTNTTWRFQQLPLRSSLRAHSFQSTCSEFLNAQAASGCRSPPDGLHRVHFAVDNWPLVFAAMRQRVAQTVIWEPFGLSAKGGLLWRPCAFMLTACDQVCSICSSCSEQ